MRAAQEEWDRLVATALAEDLGEAGDLTSLAVVPARARAVGRVTTREEGVVAGLPAAVAVFRRLDPACRLDAGVRDGQRLQAGALVLEVEGAARALLAGERTALNFLQRLSGIATLTGAFVERLRGTGCAVLETRKTTPGLRAAEKYAVRAGGGENHRFGLFDALLLKSNHFALSGEAPGIEGYRRTVERAGRAAEGRGPLAVEATTPEEAEVAVAAGAGVVLLDNMDPGTLRAAVARARAAARARGRGVVLEATGGMSLDHVREAADAGCDRVSVGALTHSPRALDLHMTLEALP